MNSNPRVGPGMAVFSRYASIVESDGSKMTVRDALKVINATLDEVLADQESDFDLPTRFAVSGTDTVATTRVGSATPTTWPAAGTPQSRRWRDMAFSRQEAVAFSSYRRTNTGVIRCRGRLIR